MELRRRWDAAVYSVIGIYPFEMQTFLRGVTEDLLVLIFIIFKFTLFLLPALKFKRLQHAIPISI